VIHAFILDFDGLICDTEGALAEAGRRLFASHGAELPMDRWLQQIGLAGPANFWVPWLEEAIGREVDEVEVMAAFEVHNHTRLAALEPNPGVVDLLDLADRHGIALGVASSSPVAWVEPLLDQLALRERFATIVCREHAVRAKPAPDLYLEAARRLAVEPARCVAFEDSHNGSLAAVAAGMTCVAVPNEVTASQDFGHADLVLARLTMARLDRLEVMARAKAEPARRSA
jgi:HAD superfamily hydrolase (TIGR01509 family)